MKELIDKVWPEFVKWGAAVLGFFAGIFGEWDITLTVLVGCMAVD